MGIDLGAVLEKENLSLREIGILPRLLAITGGYDSLREVRIYRCSELDQLPDGVSAEETKNKYVLLISQ